jgi:rhodanese-related sulfurtransferase
MPNFTVNYKQDLKNRKLINLNTLISNLNLQNRKKNSRSPNVIILMLIGVFLIGNLFGQNINKTKNAAFSEKINSMLNFSVPIMTVQELNKQKNITILDAREQKEYFVSHIPTAIYLGYKHMDKAILEDLDKSKPVVIYCSIGYRSEKMGEKLKKLGFNKVYNLYGSIFEWVNNGYALEDGNGLSTNKIHSYNKSWGKWIENNNYEKVY